LFKLPFGSPKIILSFIIIPIIRLLIKLYKFDVKKRS